MVADTVIDVYALAGIETPELSILSDEFLDGISHRCRARAAGAAVRALNLSANGLSVADAYVARTDRMGI